MPYCIVCNKDFIFGDLTTIGNQSVCCLSCVGLLKANKYDACAHCGRPVWKDNYYEINNNFFCSEKCKDITQEKLIKEKSSIFIKYKHYQEEKFFNESFIKSKNTLNNEEKGIINEQEIEKKINSDEISNLLSPIKKKSSLDNNDWNKRSFIQKSQNNNEDTSIKEEIKLFYILDKNIPDKKIKENNDTNTNNEKDNENKKVKKNNIILKNIEKYFKEEKQENIYRKLPKKSNNINNNRNNKIKQKLQKKFKNKTFSELNEINTFKSNKFKKKENLIQIPNLNINYNKIKNQNNTITINDYYIANNYPNNNNQIERISQDKTNCTENIYNQKINRSKKILNNSNKYSSNTCYIFNPTRKESTIGSKKNGNLPIDTLSSLNQNERYSNINCCYNCKKPIILRNSNAYREFCSLNCKNDYLNKKNIIKF